MGKKDMLWQDRFLQAKMQGHDQSSAAKIADECVERRDRIRAAKVRKNLAEIREYFDQRADADQPQGAASPIPNEEMKMLALLDEVIGGFSQ